MVKVLPLLGPFSVCESVIDDLLLTCASMHPCERKKKNTARLERDTTPHSLFVVLQVPYSGALVCFREITQAFHDTHHLSHPHTRVLHHLHASLLPRTFIPHHPSTALPVGTGSLWLELGLPGSDLSHSYITEQYAHVFLAHLYPCFFPASHKTL